MRSLNDFAGAVSEEREQNRQVAVRTVQQLHRNLGHPPKQVLIELLEARGASDEVLILRGAASRCDVD